MNNTLKFALISSLDFLKRGNPVYSNGFHIEKAIEWLCLAQDSTDDGGVSEGYHLYHGWLPSYPETTGYIIDSFFDYYHLAGDTTLKERAICMADWLLAIQNADGSMPDSYFRKRMVFDTGQVIFGFVRSFEETGEQKYKHAAEKAGKWLLGVQENDGAWIRFAVDEIPHTYYSRVAWSLLKLYQITADSKYRDSCIRNIEWCLRKQQQNGWFDNASFNLKNHHRPFTHTIAYTIDGILESGFYLEEARYISSAQRALDSIIQQLPKDGHVHGTFDKHWDGDDTFSCLTGNAQLAVNLFRLYENTKIQKYREAAIKINYYLKGKQNVQTKNRNIRGAIAGSYPIWGKYIHFTYPNWATKFFVDSLVLEERLSKRLSE